MPDMKDCTGSCRRTGNCECGALLGDTLSQPIVVHIPLMLKDSAQPGIGMMITDSQTTIIDEAMVDAEAAKPEYAAFRGRITGDGRPLDKHYAWMNLIRAGKDGQRAEAARDHMIDRLGKSHQPSVNDGRPVPQFARDGRPMAVLTDTERAREEMIARMSSEWRR